MKFLDRYRERKQRERDQRKQHFDDAFSRITQGLHHIAKAPRTFVCPQAIVTYQLRENSGDSFAGDLIGNVVSNIFDIAKGKPPALPEDPIEAKLREIFAAHPNVDIQPIAESLGIIILDVQKTR